MNLIYGDIKIPVDFSEKCDNKAIEITDKFIKTNKDLKNIGKYSIRIFKKSVDARNRDKIFYIYKTCVEFENEKALYLLNNTEKFTLTQYTVPDFPKFSDAPKEKICVCGFGPCGMFAALLLARAGLCPLVFEKGGSIEDRKRDVENFWKHGKLNPSSNVQFGEGGAGTFSDGKLMTRINDEYCRFVIETFIKHGADEKIRYIAKPHVGTDKLCEIVKSIRKEIISLGGEVCFNSEVTAINRDVSGKAVSVTVNNSDEIPVSAVFLAPGHSARDMFKYLLASGYDIIPKKFSVGLRIEHLKHDIDYALYGKFCEKYDMPSGEYALSRKYGERGVYTFCMCPGGSVVASASDYNQIVTNGMSFSARDGVNSNSAVAVSILEKDYGSTVMGAIEFQHNIEKNAFVMGGNDYSAPVQTLKGFMSGKVCDLSSRILPSYTGKVKPSRADSLFPEYVTKNLRYALSAFDNNIKGFASDDAVITAPETRTSSPVRIVRDANYAASGCLNVFPCGEGAGYAGGITSAAVDGIRVAMSYMQRLISE